MHPPPAVAPTLSPPRPQSIKGRTRLTHAGRAFPFGRGAELQGAPNRAARHLLHTKGGGTIAASRASCYVACLQSAAGGASRQSGCSGAARPRWMVVRRTMPPAGGEAQQATAKVASARKGLAGRCRGGMLTPCVESLCLRSGNIPGGGLWLQVSSHHGCGRQRRHTWPPPPWGARHGPWGAKRRPRRRRGGCHPAADARRRRQGCRCRGRLEGASPPPVELCGDRRQERQSPVVLFRQPLTGYGHCGLSPRRPAFGGCALSLPVKSQAERPLTAFAVGSLTI